MTEKDLVEVWRNRRNSEAAELFCYFYAKEVTEEQYCEMERKSLDAIEWGKECFGVIRVPVFELGHRIPSDGKYGNKGMKSHFLNTHF